MTGYRIEYTYAPPIASDEPITATVYDYRMAANDDDYKVSDAILNLAVNSAGSLAFTIHPTHPARNYLEVLSGTIKVTRLTTSSTRQPLASFSDDGNGNITMVSSDSSVTESDGNVVISGNAIYATEMDGNANIVTIYREMEIEENEGTVFIGRPIRMTELFDGSIRVECEGALAYLNDAVIAPHDFPTNPTPPAGTTNVVEWWFNYLLTRYNLQASRADRQIAVGTVDVADPNNYIHREKTNYDTVWNTLTEDFINSSLGGYFSVRYSGDTVYIDYLPAFDNSESVIQFGENLLDFSNSLDGSEYFNTIEPIGKDNLTIVSLSDGTYSGYQKVGAQLWNANEKAKRGGIVRIVNFDDVETAQNLLTHAIAELNRQAAGLPRTVEVSTADLIALGYQYDDVYGQFAVGTNVHVISEPHGVDIWMPCTEMTVDLLAPASSAITLGTTTQTASGMIANGSGKTVVAGGGGGGVVTNGFQTVYNGSVVASSYHAETSPENRGIVEVKDANGDIGARMYGLNGAGACAVYLGGNIRGYLQASSANGGYLRLYNADGTQYRDLTFAKLVQLLG